MRDHDDTRSTRQTNDSLWRQVGIGILWGAAAIVAVWLVLDWLNPCGGQFTDTLGCLAQLSDGG